MLEKLKNGADGAIDVGIKLISLSIVLQIIFGQKVAFLTGNVIGSILDIVWTLGNAGLAGIIAAGIVWKLLGVSSVWMGLPSYTGSYLVTRNLSPVTNLAPDYGNQTGESK